MEFASSTRNRQIWRVSLVLSVMALISFVDLVHQSFGDMPFYWVPIIIGAIYIRWRSTLLLSLAATGLSLATAWRWDTATTAPDYLERLVVGVMLSIVAVVMAREIDRRERKFRAASFMDPLTQLPNRTLLYERLGSRLRQRNLTNPTVVVFIDLDSFKHVNDTHGHGVGDEMLIEVANRLTHAVRAEDTVARLGGDEFVIMCTSITSVEGARVLSERIAAALRKPFRLNGLDVIGGGSVGCVVFDGGYIDPGELVKLADDALRETKISEKGGFRLIDRTASSTGTSI